VAAAPALGATAQEGVPVALLAFAEKDVERGDASGRWSRISEGVRLKTGERLRTGHDGLARIEFPWMKLSLSPSSELSIPGGLVLSMSLERGRVEILSEGDIIKVTSGAAEIRGQGRAIVRRLEASTLVAAREGSFRVRAEGETVTLEDNEGSVILPGLPPSPPEPLPDPPETVDPGFDPRYVRRGKPIELSWSPSSNRHHIQVLGMSSDVILLERDVGASPQTIAIPWLGTFRWRVSARDERDLEGLPSAEGLVCVVDE
jgi:hypothetical protein